VNVPKKITENDPNHFDSDPITPEEEAELAISMDEFAEGKAIHVPGSCTDEEFFKILRREGV
jgi:hypothetical protein